MNAPTRFTGIAVSDGVAAGVVYLADVHNGASATAEEVAAAFAAVAAARADLADRLRAEGRGEEADIVAVSALIAADPVLVGPAVAAVADGAAAATAVQESAESQAAVLAALDSPELAERAGDVRQVGQAVIEHLAGGRAARPDAEFILVRREVAATDLIELAEQGLVGAASVAGGASSHAAIVARGLGLPMVTGLGTDVLSITPGRQAVIDADSGELVVNPAGSDLALAGARQTASAAEHATPALARTADGWPVTVLCNVASAAETRRGLAAGASGVGLVRTEIPFGAALAWPTAAEHAAALKPILALLAGRVATVRLLDFSGDKIPPFLRQNPAASSGLAALLAHPTAAADQLRAAIMAGLDTDLAILVPMVSSPAEVAAVRELLSAIAAEVGVAVPRLGIMVELAATAEAAERFTAGADFFSIGTNDLTGQVLGVDRLDPAARPELAADPRVLRLIQHVVDVASAASTPVSVCGDSAADPVVLPLLVGLGVPAVSVPAARVGQVRSWISGLSMAVCRNLAALAITASTADDVAKLVRRAELS